MLKYLLSYGNQNGMTARSWINLCSKGPSHFPEVSEISAPPAHRDRNIRIYTNPPPHSPPGSRRGFTLIEILIVIAIIAVLAALLIPASSGIIKKSRDTQSLNNLAQISKGLEVYVAENGKYPYSYDSTGNYWVFQINPYVGNWKLGGGQSKGVFYSPNEKMHNPIADYGINNLVVYDSYTSPSQRVPATILRPSQTVLVCDARVHPKAPPGEGSWLVDGFWWSLQGTNMVSIFCPWPSRNSGGKIFAAFCDGHVEAVPGEHWTLNRTERFDPAYSR